MRVRAASGHLRKMKNYVQGIPRLNRVFSEGSGAGAVPVVPTDARGW